MKNNLLILLILPLAIIGCQSEDPAMDHDDEVVLVLVDGEPVTLPMLELMMRSRGVDEQDHETMRELLDELIRMQAAANAAAAEGIADEPEVRAERRLRDLQTLTRHYINHYQREHPVTDDEVETVYREQIERAGDTRYRIETITYLDQAEALRALAEIDAGRTDFDALRAQAEAAGRAVEQPGWVDRSQVPPDFAEAMVRSGPDEVVGVPLETSRDWRIVQVIETQTLTPPSLEEVREGIARTLLRQRRQALMETLQEQAEIEPMLPLEE